MSFGDGTNGGLNADGFDEVVDGMDITLAGMPDIPGTERELQQRAVKLMGWMKTDSESRASVSCRWIRIWSCTDRG